MVRKDNPSVCSDRNNAMRAFLDSLLKLKKQSDPIEQMIYDANMRRATMGSGIKRKYIHGIITLEQYLNAERNIYDNSNDSYYNRQRGAV